jgi:hypothetical protein
LLERLRKLFVPDSISVSTEVPPKPESESKPKKPRSPKPAKSAKDLATENGEPYISIVSVDLDPENIGSGAFELDWNDKFISNLVRSGYQYRANEPEDVIVDRWFQEVCRNVVLEHFEQEQADPELRRVSRRDLGKGRTEVS